MNRREFLRFRFLLTLVLSMTILMLFNACEKDDEGDSVTFKDYQIEVEVKNSGTQVGVSGVKVKIGAKDTGLNPEVGDFGCKNLGIKTVNGYGQATFVAVNFAGAPDICDVQVYSSTGSIIAIDDYYYNSSIRKVLIWIN